MSEHCCVVAFLVVLLVTLVAVCASLHSLHKHIDKQVEHILSSVKAHCNSTDEDVEYTPVRSLYQLHHIPNPELCRVRCKGDAKCGAWTWGKRRGVKGLSDVCFLKTWEDGQHFNVETLSKQHRHGVVSGLPCRCSSGMKGQVSCQVHWGDSPFFATTKPVPVTSSTTAPSTSIKIVAVEDITTTTRTITMSSTTSTTSTTETSEPSDPKMLFCFALMIPHSYEQTLLFIAHKRGVGIFGCDGFEVYSNQEVEITKGVQSVVVDSDLRCTYGGKFHTAMNNDIFLAVWAKVRETARYEHYHWTVKVDPDTVFFPQRLRGLLEDRKEQHNGVYLNNCKYGLHGPIEIFSRNAVKVWTAMYERCKDKFRDKDWGEDLFIDQCLEKVLKIKREDVFGILMEAHCDPPDDWDSCRDDSPVAFHPFKDVEKYRRCLEHSQTHIYLT